MKLAYLGCEEDRAYLAYLKSCVPAQKRLQYPIAPAIEKKVLTLAFLESALQSKGITHIITSHPDVVAKLAHTDPKATPDKYAGSVFFRNGFEYLVLAPLSQLVRVPYGKFLASRYITKFTEPEFWEAKKLEPLSEFSWKLFSPSLVQEATQYLAGCDLIAVDIETLKDPLSIRCISFTGCMLQGAKVTTRTYVAPMDSEFNYVWIKGVCANPVAKVFQNGKYDIGYLLHYSIPTINYIWDTANMMHATYSELPKDLAAIAAFYVRDVANWKALANTTDLYEYYKYNALDTWSTAMALISWIQEAPQYAKQNYIAEFPLVFPCILCEMTGIPASLELMTQARAEVTAEIDKENASLSASLGVQSFNTNSPTQVKKLLALLGHPDAESSDEKSLEKYSYSHPLNNWFLQRILSIRKKRKLASTYLVPDKVYKSRILYALNPHGTDTTRLASTEHHFWTGMQIQNIPRGKAVKKICVTPDDYYLSEIDLEQAESRDTAHIAGDENLIKAVTGTRDFHSVNCSAFFGVPYEEIYDDATGKQLNKALRDLAKRVNHGANYNMGWSVLLQTMGLAKVHQAATLLKLPSTWSLKDICEHLLAAFHKAYPGIRGNYYAGMRKQVKLTGYIVSKSVHIPEAKWSVAGLYDEEAWFESCGTLTRKCFSDPETSKPALNSYIAHEPQSLNAQTLNRAFMRVFYNICLNPTYSRLFYLLAQIHDSILNMYHKSCPELPALVQECMHVQVRTTGYDGKERTFVVPAAPKDGGKSWGDL